MANQYYSAQYSNGAGRMYMELHIYTIDTDTANNTTTERSDLYTVVNDSSSGWYNNYGTEAYIGINGNDTTQTVKFDARTTGVKALISTWDTVIKHNDDGTANGIGISAHHYSGVGLGNAYISGTYNCDTIARYASFTKHSSTAKSLNTITINWGSNETIDYVQYSLNGGNWVDTGGYTYTISGLSPNTNYTIKTRIRRKDSQLWTESSQISVKTYDIARITEAPNLTIGNSATIKYTNPSGATIQLGIYKTDVTTLIAAYRTVTGTSYTFNFNSTEINNMHAAIPNATSINFRYYIKTSQNNVNYYQYVERTFYLNIEASKPTFTTFTMTDVNSTTTALTGNSSKFIKGYSTLRAKIPVANKMVAKNGASAKTYSVVNVNTTRSLTYSSTADVYTDFANISNQNVKVTAVDSRGLTTTVTKTATLINYTKPAINSANTLLREGGVKENAILNFKATFWNSSFGSVTNSISQIRYRILPSTTWVTIPTSQYTISGNTITINNSKFVDANGNSVKFTVGTAYSVVIQVIDKLTYSQQTLAVSSGDSVACFNRTKKLIGVDKIPDTNLPEGSLDAKGIVASKESLPVINPGDFCSTRNYLRNRVPLALSSPTSGYNQFNFEVVHPLKTTTTNEDHFYTLSFEFKPTTEGLLPADSIVLGKGAGGDAWSHRFWFDDESLKKWNISKIGNYYRYSRSFKIGGNGIDYLGDYIRFICGNESASKVGGTLRNVKLTEGTGVLEYDRRGSYGTYTGIIAGGTSSWSPELDELGQCAKVLVAMFTSDGMEIREFWTWNYVAYGVEIDVTKTVGTGFLQSVTRTDSTKLKFMLSTSKTVYYTIKIMLMRNDNEFESYNL